MTAHATPEPGVEVGVRLRELRRATGLSARALAERLGISASAISQIERGVLRPSVARLIAITDVLGVPLSEVFDDEKADDSALLVFTLQRAAESTTMTLDNGVRFRRLSPGRTPGIDYFESVYPPGSTAQSEPGLFRHEGYEVGRMISGELTVDFDDERVILRPGDAISYPCARPHLIHNTGTETAVAQWLIVHGAH